MVTFFLTLFENLSDIVARRGVHLAALDVRGTMKMDGTPDHVHLGGCAIAA